MPFHYLTFVYSQRPTEATAPRICLFRAKVGDILSWAAIQRLSKAQPTAIQREPRRSRILGIKRFLGENPANTIPTAVVVALNNVIITPLIGCTLVDGVALSESLLSSDIAQLEIVVSEDEGAELPGLVIDGQHRLKGVSEFDAEMYLNVVAILDADDNEKAFQFIVINNKASKVPTDHIRAMVGLDYDDDVLNKRLKAARLNLDDNRGSVGVMDADEESPFYGMVKWPLNVTYDGEAARQAGIIPPAAIEGSVSYIKSKGIGDLDDSDSVDEFFIAMWSGVREQWTAIFTNPPSKNNKLLSKVGIVCLTEFLTNALRNMSLVRETRFNMSDPDKVRGKTREILEFLHPDFWMVDWKSTSYDTRAGRDQILAALDRIRGNMSEGKAWYHEVDIIKSPEISEENT